MANIPARRIGMVDEIARAVALFASDSSGYITGHVINVNGGLHL
jgi:3-oxoacyl-[acyl-carrier protein] reductase